MVVHDEGFPATALKWHPREPWITVADAQGSITTVDSRSNTAAIQMMEAPHGVRSMAWNVDHLLACHIMQSGGGGGVGTISIWDARKPSAVWMEQLLPAAGAGASASAGASGDSAARGGGCVAWDPDRRNVLAVGDSSGEVTLWDVQRPQQANKDPYLFTHSMQAPEPIVNVVWCPSTRSLVSTSLRELHGMSL